MGKDGHKHQELEGKQGARGAGHGALGVVKMVVRGRDGQVRDTSPIEVCPGEAPGLYHYTQEEGKQPWPRPLAFGEWGPRLVPSRAGEAPLGGADRPRSGLGSSPSTSA